MDKRDVRIGNWVCDKSNPGYEVMAGITEVQCADIFAPVEIQDKYLATFSSEEVEGNKVYYRGEGAVFVRLEKMAGKWQLDIHTPDVKVCSKVRYMHEVQNYLVDSHIYWKLRCAC